MAEGGEKARAVRFFQQAASCGKLPPLVVGLLIVTASVLSSHAAPLQAHQLRAAMTTVLFNDRTERIEIMHRFFLHDAEQVVGQIVGKGADLVGAADDRQRFGIYVHERFDIFTPDGMQLPLELRGTELAGDFLWVYQTLPFSSPRLPGLQMSHRALRDIWEEQVNTVNVERAGSVHTLTFRGAVTRLNLNF